MPALPRPVLHAALAALLALAGCREVREYKRPATGKTAEILVVTDTATWAGPVGEALRQEIGRLTRTLPQPTPLFSLRLQPLTEYHLGQIQRHNGVVFAAPFTDTTAAARYLRAHFDSTGLAALERGGRGIILRPDLWMQDQLVVYATAPDTAALARQIHEAGEELRQAFGALARRRTTQRMFERGRQTHVEDEMLEEHGFALNVQHDYVLAKDTTFATPEGFPAGLLRLRRLAGQDSWRDLLVYFEQDSTFRRLHPDSALALRDRLTRRLIHGTDDSTFVTVEDRYPEIRPIEADTVALADRFAIETRGTWYLATEGGRSAGMGGPFVNYVFFDETSRRLFMIDGMIFGPRYTFEEKREFLRQMEAIAHTFRTAEPGLPR